MVNINTFQDRLNTAIDLLIKFDRLTEKEIDILLILLTDIKAKIVLRKYK